MKATEVLTAEHEAVISVLKIFKHIVSLDNNADIKDIRDILEFLQVFVDKCHHTKEEEYYFPILTTKDAISNKELIEDLLKEHETGRQLVRKMLSQLDFSREEFINSVSQYVELLKNHIDKENNILFPRADMLLSENEQTSLFEKFEEVELKEIGEGKHEMFHRMIEDLQSKYSSNLQ